MFNELLHRRGDPVFCAFDLLWVNGTDLRHLPLAGRKRKLRGFGKAEQRLLALRGARGGQWNGLLSPRLRPRSGGDRRQEQTRAVLPICAVAQDQEPGVYAGGGTARTVLSAAEWQDNLTSRSRQETKQAILRRFDSPRFRVCHDRRWAFDEPTRSKSRRIRARCAAFDQMLVLVPKGVRSSAS